MPESAVIVVEPERYVEALPDIAAAVPDLESMSWSPFCLAPADYPGLDDVLQVEGVIAVDVVEAGVVRILEGIDWLIAVALGQLPKWCVGGVADGQVYPAVYDSDGGTVAPVAVCAAVNFSLTSEGDALDVTRAEDCVNHATRYLSQWAVPVLAAGNGYAPSAGFETVSPWGEPPWVLCVGATDDEAGMSEWAHSGRGTRANPDVGPDLLAWGQDALDPGEFGTSFAAPKVTFMVALAHAWLLQLAANLHRLDRQPFGVPLVGIGIIDRGFEGPRPYAPPPDWGALPVVDANNAAVGAIRPLAARLSDPQLARSLVQAAADETSPATGLSAPSIDRERFESYLDSLTAAAFSRIAGSTDVGEDDGIPLFGVGTASQLGLLLESSMPFWEYDIANGAPRMRHDERTHS